MKVRSTVAVFLFCLICVTHTPVAVGQSRETVEISRVVPHPVERAAFNLGDSIVFIDDDTLVYSSTLTKRVYELRPSGWVDLLGAFDNPIYNIGVHDDEAGWRTRIDFVQSTHRNEYLHQIRRHGYPSEYHRVFVGEDGRVEAEDVDQAYYDRHATQPPAIAESVSLSGGLQLERGTSERNPLSGSLQIVAENGEIVFDAMSVSANSFLERGGHRAAVTENGTRVAFFHRRRDVEANRIVDELIVLSIGGIGGRKTLETQ